MFHDNSIRRCSTNEITFCSVYEVLIVEGRILDYLYPSSSVKLDFSQTRVEIYNGREAQVVKYINANKPYIDQKVFLFVAHI